ncbi:MAG TPA: tetratricopeptide repeat protein [Candidatus Acidoferrum sp.]|nr:tetratricopeptide repeat protein [Candidatus Acidoferrum sp.]
MKQFAMTPTKPASLKMMSWAFAVVLMAALFCVGAPRAAAQNEGSISGQIMDVTGKPWTEIGIQAVSDQGAKSDAKTDKDGKYSIRNLRSGVYTVFVQLPAPNKAYEVQCRVQGGNDVKVDVNFKDVVAKQGAEAQEQIKKQEEEKQKFQNMKGHFDTGVALLDQVKQAKSDLAKAPEDQRETLKQQVANLSGKAVTELEGAKAAAPEKDPNLHLIYARLADAYDAAGRSDEAIAAYKQALEQKPVAAYYNNLGGIEGRAGKIDEATAAYQKSAELDPTNAAQAWRNFGITLYNASRLKDAVEPLKKSIALDPKSAQAWYLLGAALVGTMETKKVGDKLEFVIQPGTVEAYQKALELDPNGQYGVQAKQGLDALQQIAPGIDMKVNTKKKKS